ncbi:MAG TPA: four helix bundle protein [Gemmatimonadaceae bacterium]|nr:four helix bundle protein [Gemmatimonadaceae bacterium]
MQAFRNLAVWQRAHELAVLCHRTPFRRGPHASPGLRSQLLRAAASIAANIAEGAGQRSMAQFARFLEIAISSTHELDNHIELARSLGMIEARAADSLQALTWEVARMLTGLHRRVRERAIAEASACQDKPV